MKRKLITHNSQFTMQNAELGRADKHPDGKSCIKHYGASYINYALSILSGLLFACGWTCYGFTPLLFLAFVPLLIVEYRILTNRSEYSSWAMFKYVYLSVFIWNIITTWWIWNSTQIGGIMAILLNSFFMSFVFMLCHFVNRTMKRNSSVWILIFGWIAFEYMHLNWEISWPFLNLGNGLATSIKYIQWYEFTGALGGSLWILTVNILLFTLIRRLYLDDKSAVNRKRYILITSTALAVTVIVPIVISLSIYNNYKLKEGGVEVLLLQPNNDPYSDQYEKSSTQVTSELLKLANEKITDKTQVIVAPESVLQDNIWENNINEYNSILTIRNYLKQQPQCSFVIGASTFKAFTPGEPLSTTARKSEYEDLWYDAYNAGLLIDTSTHVQLIHKSKLVIGPETMVFQSLLRPIQENIFDLGGVVGSLATDKERRAFTINDDFKAGVCICYESIYGEFVTEFVNKGAEVIFVITNDGWWGDTQGHKQLVTFAGMRAIETRRDIARAANTGISCFVNQLGEQRLTSKYWEQAVLKSNVSLNDEITFYVKYGDYLGRLSSFIFIAMIIISVSWHLTRYRKK